MTRRTSILVIACLLLGACSNASPAAAPRQVSASPQASLGTPLPTLRPTPTPAAVITKAAKDLLLLLNDVPAGFRLTLDAETTAAGIAQSENTDPALMQQRLSAMGWQSGWHRQFQKDGFGAQVITSSDGIYSSADGAKLGLAENVRSTTTGTPAGVQISLGGVQLGDEALGYQIDTSSGSNQFTTIVIYFRTANVSNTIGVSGTRGLIDLNVVLDLAKKQLDREKVQ